MTLTTYSTKEVVKINECIERESFIAFLQQKEEALLEEFCGKKHCGEKSVCKRIKTRVRQIYTRFGKIVYRFVYIKNKAGKVFSPLLKHIGISKHQHMSKDLKNRLRDKASKMTYAEAVEDIANSFGFNLHRQTLWRMNQTSEELVFVKPDKSHVILLADGTKARSNKGGHHEPRVVMSIKPCSKEKSLIAFEADKSWKEIAQGMDFSNFKVLVGDGEKGLKENLVKGGMWFQFGHLHAERDLSLYLWMDKLPKLARNEFMKPFRNILYAVQGSTKKYFKDKNKARLLKRISWANEQINILANKIGQRDLSNASEFLKRNKRYFFTSAILAVKEDLQVPWTTNQAERLMKELGKRTKKKSMRWSVNGLRVILQAVLKRYFLPPEKRNYKNIFGDDTLSGG